MATVNLSTAAQNAGAEAITDLVDAGTGDGVIKLYADTIPTNANTAVGSQVLVSTHNFSAVAFGAASSGTVSADTIDDDTSAAATDTVTWARVLDSDANVVMDVDVGEAASGAVLILDDTSVTIGDTVSISSFDFTMPAS